MIKGESKVIIVENVSDLEGLGKHVAFCLETNRFYVYDGSGWQCSARTGEVYSRGEIDYMLTSVQGGDANWGNIGGALADQTDLDTALSGKASSGHNHDASYEPKNANIQTHVGSVHAPSNAQKNSDITKAEIEAKLTGVITSHSHATSGDPYTIVKLTGDFTTSSATAVDISVSSPSASSLSFTPAANQTYFFEVFLFTRTATATVGPRPGVAWPTGLTDGVVSIQEPSSATANVFANGNSNASVLSPVGGLPNTTQSWMGYLWGTFITGASPTGTFRIQLASESAGTVITAKAGSWMRYRLI